MRYIRIAAPFERELSWVTAAAQKPTAYHEQYHSLVA
jgi:hypothetical protein